VRRRPPEEAGCPYFANDRRSFVDPDLPDQGSVVPHFGAPGGVLPLSSAVMVEKDYWICHALWALEGSGAEFWFKGGTSLAKGFRLIPRFSEDLDLVLLPG